MYWLLHHKAFTIILFGLISFIIVYNVYDNNRIVVKQQKVYIDNLPPEFEGFTILQLSDLHGKRFGANQVKLVEIINGLNYDIVAITGDMASSSKDFSALVQILDGLKNKKHVFYVNGNDDKNIAYNQFAGAITLIGRQLIDHGCILLTRPYQLVRNDHSLWIINDLNRNDLKVKFNDIPRRYFLSDEDYLAYRNYFEEQEYIISQIKPTDIKIALTHIPYKLTNIQKPNAPPTVLNYSLILAGHYHGGQIRIPFYGALFLPDRIFPDQAYVSGLMDLYGVQQYVSAGLGASNLPFRLFDTPEVNIVVLKNHEVD